MNSEEMRFEKLKFSLINSIKKLKKKEFDNIIRNARKVVDSNPKAVESFSKILKSNKGKSIQFNKRKSIKIGGGRELSKDEALRDMMVIAGFCIVFFGMKIYNYLTRFKVANITGVKKTFKRNRDKRKDPLSPKPRRRVFSSNAERNSNDPFSI